MVLIKKRRDTGWTIKSIEDQKSKDKKVNKLWQKLSNMAIITGLDIKTRFSWEKKKTSNIKYIIIYFGADVFVRIFLQMLIFRAPLLIFVSWCLSLDDVSWSSSTKSSAVGCLSKYCCQCVS